LLNSSVLHYDVFICIPYSVQVIVCLLHRCLVCCSLLVPGHKQRRGSAGWH